MHLELENRSCLELFGEQSLCSQAAEIEQCLAELSELELLILSLYTGLNRYGLSLNRNQIAKYLGSSHAKISNRLKAALDKLACFEYTPKTYILL